MNNPNFLQIHWLASYPATLLNRDDSGFAKRLPFGDAMRTRISSQCLKRHWTERARLEWPQAIESLSESDFARRSRCHFRDLIAAPLIEAGYAWENVVPTVSNLREAFLKKASSNYGNVEG